MVQNYLDVFISSVQLIVLQCCMRSMGGEPIRQELSTLCVLAIAAVCFGVIVLIAFRGYQFISKTVVHNIYLCHHAGIGGVACRVFHNILVKAVLGSVFYDIDHSGHLGSIIDASNVAKNMRVAFGSETLCMPWCICTMVTAHKKGTPLYPMIFVVSNPKNLV